MVTFFVNLFLGTSIYRYIPGQNQPLEKHFYVSVFIISLSYLPVIVELEVNICTMTGPPPTMEIATVAYVKNDRDKGASQDCIDFPTNQTGNDKDDVPAQAVVESRYSLIVKMLPITVLLFGSLPGFDSILRLICSIVPVAHLYSMIMLTVLVYWILNNACYIIGWIVFQMVLERCLPAQIVATAVPDDNTSIPPETFDSEDSETKRKKKLQYRKNGHLALWVTLFTLLLGWPTYKTVDVETAALPSAACSTDYHSYDNQNQNIIRKVWRNIVRNIMTHKEVPKTVTTTTKTLWQFGTFPHWAYIYNYVPLLALTITVLCIVFYASYWYIYSFRCCYRYRLGLLSWLLLNISFGYEQYHILGYNTEGMILIQCLHFIFIWDALYYDNGESTMALLIAPPGTRATDCVSFWSLWYHLCWIPFTFSLPIRYLIHLNLTSALLNIMVLIFLAEQLIFRHTKIFKNGSNIPFDGIPMDHRF